MFQAPPPPPPPQQEINATLYIDGGKFQSWNFVDWTTEKIDPKKYDNYIDQLGAELKSAKTPRVTLSFAQLPDVAKIAQGDYSACTPSDVFQMINASTGGHIEVPPSNIDMIGYMATRLKSQGVETVLAFGGDVATPDDYDLGFSATNTPEKLAKNLALVVKKLGFSAIDFDFENSSVALVKNGAANVAQFLGALYEEGLPVTLTIQGDIGLWGPEGSAYGEIFQQGIPIQKMFHGVNLMMYATGAGLYYIDADNATWGLKQWIAALQKQGMGKAEAAAFIHMGFNPAINYTLPSSSAGKKYAVPKGLSNGAAACFVWESAQKDLGGGLTFGAPFFWNDNADYTVDQAGDCKILPKKGSFEADFFGKQKP